VDTLIPLIVDAKIAPSVRIEALGTMANIRLVDADYAAILEAHPTLAPTLFSLIQQALNSQGPMEDDDLALEAVAMIATLAMDQASLPILIKHQCIQSLPKLMRAREDDDELVLQVLFAFCHVLLVEEARELLGLYSSNEKAPAEDLIALLLDLIYDRNPLIRSMGERCLNTICDIGDVSIVQRIKTARFHLHNAEWIANVVSGRGTPDLGTSEGVSPNFADVKLLVA
jgi:hypothetical protein